MYPTRAPIWAAVLVLVALGVWLCLRFESHRYPVISPAWNLTRFDRHISLVGAIKKSGVCGASLETAGVPAQGFGPYFDGGTWRSSCRTFRNQRGHFVSLHRDRRRELWTRRRAHQCRKRERIELRRKTRVLEMESEILKRASAHFFRENSLRMRFGSSMT